MNGKDIEEPIELKSKFVDKIMNKATSIDIKEKAEKSRKEVKEKNRKEREEVFKIIDKNGGIKSFINGLLDINKKEGNLKTKYDWDALERSGIYLSNGYIHISVPYSYVISNKNDSDISGIGYDISKKEIKINISYPAYGGWSISTKLDRDSEEIEFFETLRKILEEYNKSKKAKAESKKGEVLKDINK